MIKIKNFLFFTLTIAIIATIYINRDILLTRITEFAKPTTEIVIPEANNYTKKQSFNFIKSTDNYTPYNYEDIKNIFYSALNQGWTEFTFRCPTEYTSCLKDISRLSHDEIALSDINNFVHPYNSYSTIKTLYDDTGEVTIKITHLYSDEEIVKIDKEIDKIILSVTDNNMTIEEKIKALHDHIINETKYDTKRSNEGKSEYDSARINGVLYDHYAICSGYTDLMAVILEKLNVPNFKVASSTHVWNAVYLNNTWLHLDLTWDDPVTTSGNDILDDSYFLITTEKLKSLDNGSLEHTFNKEVYTELKN